MLVPSDFNLNLQAYAVAETELGVETISHVYKYTTEAGAQGYIDTFGTGRDLRVVRLVKVRDSRLGQITTEPRLWAVQRKNPTPVIVNNLHTSESACNGWLSIFGQSYDTKKTMVEYVA